MCKAFLRSRHSGIPLFSEPHFNEITLAWKSYRNLDVCPGITAGIKFVLLIAISTLTHSFVRLSIKYSYLLTFIKMSLRSVIFGIIVCWETTIREGVSSERHLSRSVVFNMTNQSPFSLTTKLKNNLGLSHMSKVWKFWQTVKREWLMQSCPRISDTRSNIFNLHFGGDCLGYQLDLHWWKYLNFSICAFTQCLVQTKGFSYI